MTPADPRFDDAPLGILMLESRFERILGDAGNAATWPFPVMLRVVPGADSARVVLEGAPGLLPAFVTAAQELAADGARTITTSCGFLALFQAELAAAVEVPVATSALMQVPWIQATLPPGRRVGVVTASAGTLTAGHLEAVGAPVDTPVSGMEGTEFFRVVVGGEQDAFDVDRARQDVAGAARGLLAAHPDVAAIVLECTNMPPYADAVRRATGLPVHDIVSLVCWLHAGTRPRPY
jgi:Asp/Glu/hydantoin racemase